MALHLPRQPGRHPEVRSFQGLGALKKDEEKNSKLCINDTCVQ